MQSSCSIGSVSTHHYTNHSLKLDEMNLALKPWQFIKIFGFGSGNIGSRIIIQPRSRLTAATGSSGQIQRRQS